MTLHQFRILEAIAKSCNLTKAAIELHTSQPALSHQMKLLQRSYGATLYIRTPLGIALTDAGVRLLAGIRPILESVAKLKSGSALVLARKLDFEVLRVGGSFSASAKVLPTLLAHFRQRHPTAQLELRTRTSEDLERLVLSSVLALAVTVRVPRSANLAREPLQRERVAMFVLASHRLAKKQNLIISDLLAEPLVIRGGTGSAGVVDKALQQIRDRGLEFKVAMYCDGPTAIKAAVRQKMGVGLVYEDSLRTEVASGEFKILKVRGMELEGESFIIYSKIRPLAPLAQEFLILLRGVRKKHNLAHTARNSRLTVKRRFAQLSV